MVVARMLFLHFLFLWSSFFHFLIKQKLSPSNFFFISYSVKHLQRPAPHLQLMAFFTNKLINKFESLYTSHLHSQSVFLSVSQPKYRSSNLYYRLLLLLLVDISLNPGLFHNLQTLDHDEWNTFKHRGQHFLQLNINSLLPKINELGT